MPKTRSLFTKLPELALEAVMVVFAVLVALAVQEWSDERQMHEFADRARAGVLTEVRANVEEFESSGASLRAAQARLRATVQAEDLSLLNGDLSLTFPDFSAAAWRASQNSPAASYFDFDWVIRVARAYETYEVYSRVADQLIDQMSGILARGPDLDRVSDIYGRLVVLTDLHGQVQERLQQLLEEEAIEEGGA